MCTKIELIPPYKQDWDNGYLRRNGEGRDTLYLYKSAEVDIPRKQSSTQYSRYLMSTHLGRYLNKEEHVDHIDNDKNNNSLSNLQVLSLKENNIKTFKKPDVELTCPVCHNNFTRTVSQLRGKKDRMKDNVIACSRMCGGKLSHVTKNNKE